MLVLTRRLNETIVLPDIDTTFQLLAVRGGSVRLGVQAPEAVAVLRGEVWEREKGRRPAPDLPQGAAPADHRRRNHALRNRLNAASIGLGLLRRQLQAGPTADANTTVAKLEGDFDSLGREAQALFDQARSESPPPARPRRALLVEDDQNERELLAGFLRLAGLQVDTAGDGSDALDYLHSHDRPDVMLLDMVMPRCDGPATLRAIRGEPALSGLKVFAISGHTPDSFGLDQAGVRVDRWVSKPFNPEVLLRELTHTFADRS